ncbi:hypothetical protein Ddye_026638 [Dipteronia dyeriana]|uniref:Uncharacterized protein n=1 Tax=Dipteronia dyeriana TaxID=168575 RepID=A0AAD9TNC9_9ROSI|nr:hypothetical protein Ddye_026638 [Dipteronia dyeriana]
MIVSDSQVTVSWINNETFTNTDHAQVILNIRDVVKNEEVNGCVVNGVTTLKLATTIVFSVWKEILWTAFLALAYTLASYVGPYLIDTFVQYLSGRWEFDNERYLLVSTLFVAKLVECLSLRHWLFKLQEVGIRIRAVNVAMIYNKGF